MDSKFNPATGRRRWLSLAAAWGLATCLPAQRADAARPAAAPGLLLAQEAPADLDPAGFLVSEKLDGVRAHWDGQVLRFRSGLPVAAPAWFTARLPAVQLDGELWLGRGRFEALSAAVRRHQPEDAEWRALRFMVFELPGGSGTYAQRARDIEDVVRRAGWAQLQAVEQASVADRAALGLRLQQVVSAGGEGLMLHRADAPYISGRSPALLKLKPLHDAEALVVAHVPGRGRHARRLGALRVRTEQGREFLIGTGFSDAERENPPPVGTHITYTHRGWTSGEVPRFASFLRRREM